MKSPAIFYRVLVEDDGLSAKILLFRRFFRYSGENLIIPAKIKIIRRNGAIIRRTPNYSPLDNFFNSPSRKHIPLSVFLLYFK